MRHQTVFFCEVGIAGGNIVLKTDLDEKLGKNRQAIPGYFHIFLRDGGWVGVAFPRTTLEKNLIPSIHCRRPDLMKTSC